MKSIFNGSIILVAIIFLIFLWANLFDIPIPGEEIHPVVGEVWVMHDEADPFPPKADGTEINVIGVNDGWVRYSFAEFPDSDERLVMRSFLYIYSKKAE